MFTRQKMMLLVLPLLTVVALSCGKKTDPCTPTDLEGTWSTGCISPGSGSTKTNVTVACLSVTVTGMMYSDGACATPLFTMTEPYTMAIGDTITVASGSKTAKKINQTLNSVTLTPESAAMATTFNNSNPTECGLTGWVSGTGKDITGKTCSTLGSIPAAGTVSYDIYQIDTTVTPNKVYFGKTTTGDGKTDATRPTDVDTSPTSTLSRQ